MSILNLKALKSLTKTAAPVEKTVKWKVEVTDQNIEELKKVIKSDIQIGDEVDVEGQVFIKKLSYKEHQDAVKAYEWDFNPEDPEKSKLKNVDVNHLTAARLLGSVCEDAKGTPFFKNTTEVLGLAPNFVDALYSVSDEVNNFLGKSRKKNSTETKSGVSSSSMESVEKPLKKPKGT